MLQQRRFKFVRPFTNKGETIPAGPELTLIGDRVFFNGGQIMPGLHDLFYNLIMQEIKRPYYLREIPVPYNKA